MTDYYSILGLDRDCSRDDIRNAYRRLAKQYHPDVNKSPDAPEKFRKISEAYEYLLKVKDGAQPDIPAYAASGSSAGRAASGGRQYNIRPLEEIMTALKSNDNTVVMAAIEALGSRRFYENQAVMHVLATYLHSQDILLRRSAVIALGRLGNPAAITDLAKMLKDEEPHVRFDAIVALGNIGAPAALTYLEMMDRNDHRNNEMVMNARDESVYSIKKNSGMYGPERKCPYCSGYDGKSKSGPYKCHECGRTFGTADRQSKEKSKNEGVGAGKQCVACHSESRLGQCKFCGQTYCSSHISPEEHQCSHRNQMGTAENHAGMKRPRHSKVVRNLAILAVMLALVMIIGAIVALNTNHNQEGPGTGGLTATVTPVPTLHPFQDYIGTWHSYEANESVQNTYDNRYLVIYPDNQFTMRHDTQDRQDIFHGVWSNHGSSGLILKYNDGTVQDIPASQQFVIDETYKDAAFAYYVNSTGGRTSVGMLFKKMSSTPGMYVPST